MKAWTMPKSVSVALRCPIAYLSAARWRANLLSSSSSLNRGAERAYPSLNSVALFNRPAHSLITHTEAHTVSSDSFQRPVDVMIHDQLLPLLRIDISVDEALEEGDE